MRLLNGHAAKMPRISLADRSKVLRILEGYSIARKGDSVVDHAGVAILSGVQPAEPPM